MAKRSDIRRLAMQAMYQLDLRGEADSEAIAEALGEDADDAATGAEAMKLAMAAWRRHEEADAMATQLAPDWPTYRQPPVDRAILRLAFYEMASGAAPVKVAINEAVELAKHYCAENSPAFINGVLDKMAKLIAPPAGDVAAATPTSSPPDPVAWLSDAVGEQEQM
jgi:N utilization substance protein B